VSRAIRGNSLWSKFGASFVSRGSSSGNCQTLTGQPGTFVAGMEFGYADGGPNAYTNQIDAAGGTVIFRDQSDVARAVSFNPDLSRTVMSSVLYGAFSPGYERGQLMTAYLDYLLHGLAVGGEARVRVERVGASPNPARSMVRFSAPGASRLSVLDLTGRTLAEWRVGTGSACVSWDLTADGRRVPPGTYLVRASGRGTASTRPFVVVR